MLKAPIRFIICGSGMTSAAVSPRAKRRWSIYASVVSGGRFMACAHSQPTPQTCSAVSRATLKVKLPKSVGVSVCACNMRTKSSDWGAVNDSATSPTTFRELPGWVRSSRQFPSVLGVATSRTRPFLPSSKRTAAGPGRPGFCNNCAPLCAYAITSSVLVWRLVNNPSTIKPEGGNAISCALVGLIPTLSSSFCKIPKVAVL